MKKVRFLHDRNPGVPGIIYKLEENEAGARKLNNARQLWKTVATVSDRPIKNILEHNLKPLYESAKLQGYELWRFGGSVNCDVTFDEGSEGFYLAAERNSSPKP